MIKYFVVSDIHSFYDPLIKALNDKGFDFNNKEHKLIICGDAFDRGDDTVKVFSFLKEMQSQNRLIYIMGNHEELLFECYAEICQGYSPSNHHVHNGTVKTISMLCGETSDYHLYCHGEESIKNVIEKTQELRDFIHQYCVDYFTLGNKIFVHSWIPCKIKGMDYTWNPIYIGVSDLWDKNPNTLNEKDFKLYNSEWSQARWDNPFLKWKNKSYPENKCIVFGHFHTSYGHSRIDMKCKEWPQKNQNNWQEAFKPWIKENAIGLDSCVAYSGFINCIVFDEEGNLLDQ